MIFSEKEYSMIRPLIWLVTVVNSAKITVDGDEIEEGQGATLRCQPSSDAQNGSFCDFCEFLVKFFFSSLLEFCANWR